MAEPFRGIDLEAITHLLVSTLLTDGDGRDPDVETEDYLRVIEAWHQQEVAVLKAKINTLEQVVATSSLVVRPQLGSGQKIPRPARTMCELGRPLRDHARPCAPACDFRP